MTWVVKVQVNRCVKTQVILRLAQMNMCGVRMIRKRACTIYEHSSNSVQTQISTKVSFCVRGARNHIPSAPIAWPFYVYVLFKLQQTHVRLSAKSKLYPYTSKLILNSHLLGMLRTSRAYRERTSEINH